MVITILCAHATRSKCVDLDRPVTWAWCWLSDSRKSAPMSRRFWSFNSGFMKSQGVQGVFLAAPSVQIVLRFDSHSFLVSTPPDALHLTMLLPPLLRRTQAPLTSLTRSRSLLHRSFASTAWPAQRVLQADEDSLARLPGLDASKLEITETITPKKIVPPEELVFGRTFTGGRSATAVRHEALLTHSSQTTCCP